jgi:hypothetical protein
MRACASTAYVPGTHGASLEVLAEPSPCSTSESVRGLPGMTGVEWITSWLMLIWVTLSLQTVLASKKMAPVAENCHGSCAKISQLISNGRQPLGFAAAPGATGPTTHGSVVVLVLTPLVALAVMVITCPPAGGAAMVAAWAGAAPATASSPPLAAAMAVAAAASAFLKRGIDAFPFSGNLLTRSPGAGASAFCGKGLKRH